MPWASVVDAIQDNNVFRLLLIGKKLKNEGYMVFLNKAVPYAVKVGYVDILDVLINDLGADINARDNSGVPAIIHAASSDDKIECLKWLIEAEADVNITDKSSHRTPLSIAAIKGSVNCLRLLANIEAVRKHEKSVYALLYAAANGHLECMKILLEAGFDVETRDDRGTTPLMVAASTGQDAAVQFLIERGADVNKCDRHQTTPLMYAVRNKNESCVVKLLEAGADLSLKDDSGYTAEDFAKMYNYKRIADILHWHKMYA